LSDPTPPLSLSPEPGTPGPQTSLPAPREEEPEALPAWSPPPDKLLCALLFASQEYQSGRALREILGEQWDLPKLRQLVKGLNHALDSSEMPFEAVEVEGTFRLRTRPQYFPWIRKLFKDSAPRRLSQASLETLAIVAYKQPITKAEIESIRGVNVDASLKTLLDKKLIDIGKRSDGLGQAFTYHTTREFMRYFGISRVPDDLPRLSEFEGILNAQSLIPQMGASGEAREMVQPEPEAEQMTLGMPPPP
jgi:segregation and condensation protein B